MDHVKSPQAGQQPSGFFVKTSVSRFLQNTINRFGLFRDFDPVVHIFRHIIQIDKWIQLLIFLLRRTKTAFSHGRLPEIQLLFIHLQEEAAHVVRCKKKTCDLICQPVLLFRGNRTSDILRDLLQILCCVFFKKLFDRRTSRCTILRMFRKLQMELLSYLLLQFLQFCFRLFYQLPQFFFVFLTFYADLSGLFIISRNFSQFILNLFNVSFPKQIRDLTNHISGGFSVVDMTVFHSFTYTDAFSLLQQISDFRQIEILRFRRMQKVFFL